MIALKKKLIIGLALTAVILAAVCYKLYYDKEYSNLMKPADTIYNLIVSDKDANCGQEVRDMANDIDFCYETERFFNDQPLEQYAETKQCSYSKDGNRAFGIAVIKLKEKDGSYEEANEAFEDWLFDWTNEKRRVFNNAYEIQEGAEELLKPYELNSAIARSEDTIVILYNNEGIQLLSKYFNKVEQLFEYFY